MSTPMSPVKVNWPLMKAVAPSSSRRMTFSHTSDGELMVTGGLPAVPSVTSHLPSATRALQLPGSAPVKLNWIVALTPAAFSGWNAPGIPVMTFLIIIFIEFVHQAILDMIEPVFAAMGHPEAGTAEENIQA